MLQASRAIKEMNGDLNSAKVFSKMDLNQGYNQLVLAPASKYITTYSSHMDLMPYKRLNFIVLSTAWISQNVTREILEGIDGAIKIRDDIQLVFSDFLKIKSSNK